LPNQSWDPRLPVVGIGGIKKKLSARYLKFTRRPTWKFC
jgi:hypothetical protein